MRQLPRGSSTTMRQRPAARGALKTGDVIVAVKGERVSSQAEFYGKFLALGPAGVTVPLTVYRDGRVMDLKLQSADRAAFLKRPRLH